MFFLRIGSIGLFSSRTGCYFSLFAEELVLATSSVIRWQDFACLIKGSMNLAEMYIVWVRGAPVAGESMPLVLW